MRNSVCGVTLRDGLSPILNAISAVVATVFLLVSVPSQATLITVRAEDRVALQFDGQAFDNARYTRTILETVSGNAGNTGAFSFNLTPGVVAGSVSVTGDSHVKVSDVVITPTLVTYRETSIDGKKGVVRLSFDRTVPNGISEGVISGLNTLTTDTFLRFHSGQTFPMNLRVTMPGDWSSSGVVTGAHQILNLNPQWTIDKNFTFNGVNTTFAASLANYSSPAGNSNSRVRLYGSPVGGDIQIGSLTFKDFAPDLAQGAKNLSLAFSLISLVTDPFALGFGTPSQLDIDLFAAKQIAPDPAKFAISAVSLIKSAVGGNWVKFLLSGNALIYNELARQLTIYGNDPLDPNYKSVVQPQPIDIGAIPKSGNEGLDKAIEEHFKALIDAVALLQAHNVSFDRYTAALAAGDTDSANMQAAAMASYLASYARDQKELTSKLDALNTELLLLNIDFGIFDSTLFSSVSDDILNNGLSNDVRDFLVSMDFSQSQIDEVRDGVLSILSQPNQYNASDSMLELSSAFFFAPASTVPTPATNLLMVLGLIGLVLSRKFWGCIRR